MFNFIYYCYIIRMKNNKTAENNDFIYLFICLFVYCMLSTKYMYYKKVSKWISE